MIQSAKDIPLHELFSPDLNIKYAIPRYQREYSWRRENWEDMFNDILGENEHDEGPFLGSIICVSKTKETFSPMLEIIDGQQRLTTISLLFAAIYSRLKTENMDTDEFKSELINLKFRLIHKKNPKETKLELSYQNHNSEDYLEILEESGILEVKEGRPKNLGKRRLYKAYSYFSVKLEAYSFEETKKILDKLNSSHLIKIEVNSNSDAFNLFESINNRGVPLSAIDLIKNNILSSLERKKIKNIEDAFEDWSQIVENLTDNPKTQERFLRHYYNGFKHDEAIKIKIKEGRATKSNLLKIYDELIDRDVLNLLNDLKEKSLTYNRLIDPQNNDYHYEELIDLLRINGVTSYMFLLYLVTEFSSKKEMIRDTISFLGKYFVRRNLTDYPATRNLDNIFISLIEECNTHKKNISFEIIKTFLINPERFASNELFREKLEGDIYETNADVARFVLCKIESTKRTKEDEVDLWKKNNKDKYTFTIEHIFPEGERIPSDWVKMIANGNKEEAKRLQNLYVHKLGNLTLTGYNSNLSNLSFEKKLNRKDNSGREIGYKNKLYLNNEIYPLSKKHEWTIEDINERTQILINTALKLFNVK